MLPEIECEDVTCQKWKTRSEVKMRKKGIMCLNLYINILICSREKEQDCTRGSYPSYMIELHKNHVNSFADQAYNMIVYLLFYRNNHSLVMN